MTLASHQKHAQIQASKAAANKIDPENKKPGKSRALKTGVGLASCQPGCDNFIYVIAVFDHSLVKLAGKRVTQVDPI